MSKLYLSILCIFFSCFVVSAQEEFSIYQQFNGRYDFTFIGNTMNFVENGSGIPCLIQTSSSATLQLQPQNQIENAYLYWSGSGSGDLEVELNGESIIAERHFNLTHSNLVFFVAFADVTELVKNAGNTDYTLSELDISSIIHLYCPNATNYAGWSIVVVYKNDDLPLNQLNVYDGFKNVPNELTITLGNLNVMDNEGAKIGFVAWEGDSSIAVNETLRVNGNIMSNPPLNPANNAFNGTNSITGTNTLFNMDLDIYYIHNNIEIGDTTATVQLTSGQDLVMISTVVTKLNSQLPDAEITLDNTQIYCNSRDIDISYTVYNSGTDVLVANTPIAVYINNTFIVNTFTINDIQINQTENGSILVAIPDDITADAVEIHLVVDDLGDGEGIVVELNEDNNWSDITTISLLLNPEFNKPEDITSCNLGNITALFDFSDYQYSIQVNDTDWVWFYESLEDANNGANPIANTSSYQSTTFPKEIFVRIDNGICYSITSFFLRIKNCPPTIYNGVSANNDGYNDEFLIEGLYDIFPKFDLSIYTRWGQLIWKGNNNTPMWRGTITEKSTIMSEDAPEGTYFYILHLNDPEYPDPYQGYIYLTR